MSEVEVTIEHGAATVLINRPDARNALSRAVNQRLIAVVAELEANTAVRVVVVRGAGDQAFCAGADLKERKGVPASETGAFLEVIAGACNAFANLSKPTIAVLNGSAYGGGLELALACDFRIAADHVELGLTEVRLGIMPGAGGTQRLTRLIGMARAKEMILLGKRVSAQRAAEWGLLNQVVPTAQLDETLASWLSELAKCAPLSVISAKRAIEQGAHLAMPEALQLERTCYDVTLFSDDRNEGLLAFAEKRAPNFQGK